MSRMGRWGAAALAAAWVMVTAGGASAATLVEVSGVLVGATGVNVEGRLYDVSFLDGRCVDLFDGCDEPSDFTFTTQASALAASQALIDQVFKFQYDFNPEFTRGCPDRGICFVLTPFDRSAGSSVLTAQARNGVVQNEDLAVSSSFGSSFNTSGNFVYAVWSVPEPGVLSLLLAGLATLVTRRRSNHRIG